MSKRFPSAFKSQDRKSILNESMLGFKYLIDLAEEVMGLSQMRNVESLLISKKKWVKSYLITKVKDNVTMKEFLSVPNL